MKDKFFHSICYLDTNIFVYMHDENEAEKKDISNYLYKLFLQTGNGRISIQVISEWRNIMIKKFSMIVSKEARRNFIRLFEAWEPLVITPELILKSDKLCDHYNFSPYDAIHIQCALEQNCQFFLSEDFQERLIVNNKLTIINPYNSI